MIKKRLLKADITVREIIEMIDSVLYIGEKEEESRWMVEDRQWAKI